MGPGAAGCSSDRSLLAWRVAGYLGMAESVARLLRSYRALLPRSERQAA